MKRWRLIGCLAILPFMILTRSWAEDDPLKKNTKEAQKRVEKWDEEDHKIEKKENWEIPVVAALGVVGAVFYEGGRTPGYIACGVAAGGLTIRFWPFGHHKTQEN